MALKKITMDAVIVAAVVGVLLTVSTIGVLGAPKGAGKVQAVNVRVYSDSGCTVSCGAIDWGMIKPDSVVERVVYVKNSGSGVMTLRFSVDGWSPDLAGSVIKVTWNLGNKYRLGAGEVVPVTLSLRAAADTLGLTDFSFNVLISGTVR